MIAVSDQIRQIRIIDFQTLQSVSSLPIWGNLKGLSCFKQSQTFAVIEDRSISIFDIRGDNPPIQSNILNSPPVTISCYENIIFSANEDRKIRIFDNRKLDSPMLTSKPVTKYLSISLHIIDQQNVICFGEDGTIVLPELKSKIGQLKLRKYLSESPFISSQFIENDRLSILTRNGVVHSFTNIFEYFSQAKNENKR